MSRHPLIHKTLVSTGVAVALSLTATAHATNGYFSHGYGIQSKGAAGVGAALPQDSLAAATNPAGLVDLGNRLDAGVDLFAPQREAAIHGNGFGADARYDGNDTSLFYIPEFGYNHLVNPDLALGIAVYGNGGMNTDYGSNPYQRYGATGPAGVDLTQLFISPAVAYRLNDKNSVGIALNLAYQRFKADGISAFSGFSANPAHLSNNGYDSSTGYGVRLGWQGKLNDVVTLGASWQSKTKTGKFDKYSGLFADGGSFDIPETYVAGVAVKATPDLTLALDWQKILYSDVPAVGNSFAKLLQGQPLGSNDGPGFGWRDISIIKLGVIYQVSPSLKLRAGFSSSQQPVPQNETFFNILAPGVVQKHITLGSTWNINADNAVSVAYTRGLKQTVKGAGSIPPGLPPAGLGGGEADIQLEEDSLGVAWQLKF
ncbi:MAG: outer membrane protein transport protein [bacterium]|nr:outer membrane protein transport protein [bacterium]